MIQQEHVTTPKTALEPIPLRLQEPLNRLLLELIHHQMHLNHLDPRHLERHRLQHLQLRPPRLQTQIIYPAHIHRQHQRVQREALDPRVEAVLVVQAVRGNAVDLDAVALLLVEGHLLGVRGGAEAGVHRLRSGPIVALQVEIVAGVRLDEEAAPRHFALEVFGFGGFAVVVGARFDEEAALLERDRDTRTITSQQSRNKSAVLVLNCKNKNIACHILIKIDYFGMHQKKTPQLGSEHRTFCLPDRHSNQLIHHQKTMNSNLNSWLLSF